MQGGSAGEQRSCTTPPGPSEHTGAWESTYSDQENVRTTKVPSSSPGKFRASLGLRQHLGPKAGSEDAPQGQAHLDALRRDDLEHAPLNQDAVDAKAQPEAAVGAEGHAGKGAAASQPGEAAGRVEERGGGRAGQGSSTAPLRSLRLM